MHRPRCGPRAKCAGLGRGGGGEGEAHSQGSTQLVGKAKLAQVGYVTPLAGRTWLAALRSQWSGVTSSPGLTGRCLIRESTPARCSEQGLAHRKEALLYS